MKLIVGLGNPGEKYQFTRHNIGFMTLDHFLKDEESVDRTLWKYEVKFKSEIAEFNFTKKGANERIILVKPQTYMNNSGQAVLLVSSFYKILPSDIWVVHDDIDLNLGTIRIRVGGGSGGHRGIESLISVLPSPEFVRFRLGIGRPFKEEPRHMGKRDYEKVDEFVLSDFPSSEDHEYKDLIKKCILALEDSLENDILHSMNRYNN